MDETNNTWAWVGGIIVVVLVIAGIWWWSTQPSSSTQASGEATTTAATSTEGVPVSVNNSESAQTVASIVEGLSAGSAYGALFSSTGVGATLNGKGPYTVFVSSDAGIALLKPGTISGMTAAQQKRFIQYSIISKELDVNVQDNGSVKALSGDELNFTVGTTGLVQVNSSYALDEYKASNGIVYVLNQPLLPPTGGNILTP